MSERLSGPIANFLALVEGTWAHDPQMSVVSRRRLHLDAYVRVSDVRGRHGPSFISPAQQRERIEAWCELYNAHIEEVFEELDESGRRADRPAQALERVELAAGGELSDGGPDLAV
jgi:hypothetical protein